MILQPECVQRLLDSGRTLRDIEDYFDWIENQACEDTDIPSSTQQKDVTDG